MDKELRSRYMFHTIYYVPCVPETPATFALSAYIAAADVTMQTRLQTGGA